VRAGAMNIQRDGIRNGRLEEWVLRLLLVVFALRALVPPGYMPELSALSKGVLKVVICTASGTKTVDADEPDHPNPAPHHDQPCAFAGLVAFDVPQLEPVAVQNAVARSAGLIAPLAVSLPPARAGPILGSRGPPSNS
jgi:hypothetical protein